jgi:hypothetical protein
MARLSYYGFLALAQRHIGLTYRDAQRLYRETRDLLGRPADEQDFWDIWGEQEPDRIPRTWEVTAVKRTRRNRHPLTIDLTFRVEVADDVVPTKESVAKAVWAWAVHGRELESYAVQGINWRNTYRGRESEYEYDEPGEAQREAGWVLRSVGLAKLRSAPVEN